MTLGGGEKERRRETAFIVHFPEPRLRFHVFPHLFIWSCGYFSFHFLVASGGQFLVLGVHVPVVVRVWVLRLQPQKRH